MDVFQGHSAVLSRSRPDSDAYHPEPGAFFSEPVKTLFSTATAALCSHVRARSNLPDQLLFFFFEIPAASREAKSLCVACASLAFVRQSSFTAASFQKPHLQRHLPNAVPTCCGSLTRPSSLPPTMLVDEDTKSDAPLITPGSDNENSDEERKYGSVTSPVDPIASIQVTDDAPGAHQDQGRPDASAFRFLTVRAFL